MNSLKVFYSYSTSIVYSLGKCRISIERIFRKKGCFQGYTSTEMTEIV